MLLAYEQHRQDPSLEEDTNMAITIANLQIYTC